ncbi:MAG: DUF1223 domain-containing protein [Hyphomicrobiales bacterium]|nr:DUF1223 domain-containing protein [Hyphomicrobiales bacterium]
MILTLRSAWSRHALFCIAGVAALGAAASARAESRPVVVMELFTSQGCASCPAADALFHKFAARSDVIALTLSVDYWDHIGWKDTLARPENAKRQRAYARKRPSGDGRIYTPQLVFNGVACAPAKSEKAIEAELVRVPKTDPARAPMRAHHAGDDLVIDVGEAAPHNATLWLFHVSPRVDVNIERGENSGRSVAYANAVRGIVNLGGWTGAAAQYRAKASAPAGDFYVALVQSDETGAVLNAIDIRR